MPLLLRILNPTSSIQNPVQSNSTLLYFLLPLPLSTYSPIAYSLALASSSFFFVRPSVHSSIRPFAHSSIRTFVHPSVHALRLLFYFAYFTYLTCISIFHAHALPCILPCMVYFNLLYAILPF